MTYRMNIPRLAAAIAATSIILSFAGCKSSKQTQTHPQTPTQQSVTEDVTATPSRARSAASDFALMTESYTPWTSMEVPVKVSLTKPKKTSVSGTLTMVYGKCVAMTVKMLFIEAASMYADNDSVIIVSRPLGKYYKESMRTFTANLGLTLSDLQSVLLGQAFEPGKGTARSSAAQSFAFDAKPLDDELTSITVSPLRQSDKYEWNYTFVSPTDLALGAPRLMSIGVKAGDNSLTADYMSFDETACGLAASSLEINGTAKKRTVAASVTTNFGRAAWNTGANPSKPRIPAGATRITTEQIFKLLK
ncbi:MAG: DUF4292 domain-containing protein [Muribaculaceae bacterium]|nr:DUF4292 domain-containing protein [Muribaculaceae bacterium]